MQNREMEDEDGHPGSEGDRDILEIEVEGWLGDSVAHRVSKTSLVVLSLVLR